MDLFDYMKETTMEKESPLASRMRPTTLDEVVGQEHIIGPGKLLYRAIKADKLGSVIFYGLRERENDACPRHRQHDKRRVYPAECHDSRQKGYGRSRKRSAAADRHVRQKDDSFCRRDPPLQQGATGLSASVCGGRHTRSDWRDDGKPVFRGQRGADFAFHYL